MSPRAPRAGIAANQPAKLVCRPLTPERFADLEQLFGKNGAYGGCWCMWWRLSRAQFQRLKGAGNRGALRRLVAGGEVPGILAYRGETPVGWCAVAPRERFAAIERSPTLRRIDDRPVWSITCFYVARAERGQGVARALLSGAVRHARARGARTLEAYPTVPRAAGELPPVSSFVGVPSLFFAAGFAECARPSPARMIVRRELRPARRTGARASWRQDGSDS